MAYFRREVPPVLISTHRAELQYRMQWTDCHGCVRETLLLYKSATIESAGCRLTCGVLGRGRGAFINAVTVDHRAYE